MWSRTGTFFHGLRFGGSRIRPALVSISPGVATPTAATSSGVSFAAATARRIVSHIVSSPASWPRSGWVSMTTGADSGRPASSTTAAFMVVPPTSSPTYFFDSAMTVRLGWCDPASGEAVTVRAGSAGDDRAGGRRSHFRLGYRPDPVESGRGADEMLLYRTGPAVGTRAAGVAIR